MLRPYCNTLKAEYAALGAARLSLGSALARVTHKAIYVAAKAMFGPGDFSPLGTAMSGDEVDRLLAQARSGGE